jgi:hypothetical protein
LIYADDSSLLVVLLETHQSLWSELSEEDSADDLRSLSLTKYFQQARLDYCGICGIYTALLHYQFYSNTLGSRQMSLWN